MGDNIMYKDIYDLIVDKSSKGRILSKSDIKYIAKRIAHVYGVDKYDFDIDVIYRPYSLDARALFDLVSGHIVFNQSKFKRLYKNEPFFLANSALIYELVHEITHIEQMNLIKCHSIDDFDDPLIKLEYYLNKTFMSSLFVAGRPMFVPTVDQMKVLKNAKVEKDKDFYINLRLLYEKAHDYLPCERIANIRGLNFAINLIEANAEGKKREKLALYAMKRYLYGIYLRGYADANIDLTPYVDSNVDVTPIIMYMSMFGLSEDIPFIKGLIEEINDKYILDDETRMTYGLNISEDIMNKTKNTKEDYNDKLAKLSKKK
jgi:hypothetical protein